MGVEHIGVCHTCKQFIDCHKCYSGVDFMRAIEDKRTPTLSDFKEWGETVGYWGFRLIWFMLTHVDHKKVILTDHDDDRAGYYELQGRYQEVLSYKEMQQQDEGSA